MQTESAVFAGARDGSVRKWAFGHVDPSVNRRGATKESSKDLLKKISSFSSPKQKPRRAGIGIRETSPGKLGIREEPASEGELLSSRSTRKGWQALARI